MTTAKITKSSTLSDIAKHTESGVVDFLENLMHAWKSDTPPAPDPAQVPGQMPVATSPVAHKSAAVAALQRLLNKWVKPSPPLAEDGWPGPATEKALLDAIEMAKSYGFR